MLQQKPETLLFYSTDPTPPAVSEMNPKLYSWRAQLFHFLIRFNRPCVAGSVLLTPSSLVNRPGVAGVAGVAGSRCSRGCSTITFVTQ